MSALEDVCRKIAMARSIPDEIVVTHQQYNEICDDLRSIDLTKIRGLAIKAGDGIAFTREQYPLNVLVRGIPLRWID